MSTIGYVLPRIVIVFIRISLPFLLCTFLPLPLLWYLSASIFLVSFSAFAIISCRFYRFFFFFLRGIKCRLCRWRLVMFRGDFLPTTIIYIATAYVHICTMFIKQ